MVEIIAIIMTKKQIISVCKKVQIALFTNVVWLVQVDDGPGGVADNQHEHHRSQHRHHRLVSPEQENIWGLSF